MRKRSWSKRDEPAQSTSKADIHHEEVMLSVWWDLATPKEPNYQVECLLSPADEIGQRNQGKATRTGKS